MNAPLALHKLQVRAADLCDRDECRRIDAFVHDMPDGTPFHLTSWLKAIEDGCGQTPHMLLCERAGELRGVLPLTGWGADAG